MPRQRADSRELVFHRRRRRKREGLSLEYRFFRWRR
jgi:hypothetical protein